MGRSRFLWLRFFLALLVLAVLGSLLWANASLYHGVCDVGAGAVLLTLALVLLATPDRKIRFSWLRMPRQTVLVLVLCLAAAALFLLFRPACTLKEAQEMLDEAGYTHVGPNPAYSHMGLVHDGNPLVSTGYVLRGVLDGEERVVFVNPVNGEWWEIH